MTVHMNPWQEVGPGSASGGGISNTTTHSTNPETAIAPDGTPYVVWDNFEGYPSTDHRIYIRRWNGAAWQEVGNDSAGGGGLSQGFGSAFTPAITPGGTPYVAWYQAFGGSGIADIYVRRWNGSHWEEAGLGSASGMGISGTTAARDPSLAVSIDGTVYAAWRDHNFDGSFPEIYVRQYYE